MGLFLEVCLNCGQKARTSSTKSCAHEHSSYAKFYNTGYSCVLFGSHLANEKTPANKETLDLFWSQKPIQMFGTMIKL